MTQTILEGVSVIMPTYNQAEYISRAITSLLLQTHNDWELIVINDSSTDNTKLVINEYAKDSRIRYFENDKNEGMGFSINKGLSLSKYNFISYLPSDDIYFANHIESLFNTLKSNPKASLAFSGVKHAYFDNAIASSYKVAIGRIENYPLQMVQVMHIKTEKRWLERHEFVTDDLNRMFWDFLLPVGDFVQTKLVSCEWVDHPGQRHKIINEKFRGGIYLYRKTYNVDHALKFQSTSGIYIDEEIEFERFRNKEIKLCSDGLKILLVGELAYNPERIFALEEAGHKLYGLWMTYPGSYNTVGPLQFGNVEDIPGENWFEKIKEIQPDIIYALLNHQAVPIAHFILFQNLGIPFVWHFKEGPFYSRQYGKWKQLVELYVNADGQIYTNKEARDWFQQFIDKDEQFSMLLDGDLPKSDWFTDDISPKLSNIDGEIHTVVPGRPMGLTPENIAQLSQQKIHLHLYGDIQQSFWTKWIDEANVLAPGYLHLHPHCTAENWVKEFSKYDAGWLHYFESDNYGEIMRTSWLDLNYPARMPTLAAAGLPMLQKNNKGHIAATYSLIESKNLGISFDSFEDLGTILRDKLLMSCVSKSVWENRMLFTFDHYVDELVLFFRDVIKRKKSI